MKLRGGALHCTHDARSRKSSGMSSDGISVCLLRRICALSFFLSAGSATPAEFVNMVASEASELATGRIVSHTDVVEAMKV